MFRVLALPQAGKMQHPNADFNAHLALGEHGRLEQPEVCLTG